MRQIAMHALLVAPIRQINVQFARQSMPHVEIPQRSPVVVILVGLRLRRQRQTNILLVRWDNGRLARCNNIFYLHKLLLHQLPNNSLHPPAHLVNPTSKPFSNGAHNLFYNSPSAFHLIKNRLRISQHRAPARAGTPHNAFVFTLTGIYRQSFHDAYFFHFQMVHHEQNP